MIEQRTQQILQTAYAHSPLDIFEDAGADQSALEEAKQAAERLIALRLAKFKDEGRTQIELTNAGRYWAMHGGYLAFLKEEPPTGGGRQRNPELEALRLNYMRLRLNTFWWSFGLSMPSFVISLL